MSYSNVPFPWSLTAKLSGELSDKARVATYCSLVVNVVVVDVFCGFFPHKIFEMVLLYIHVYYCICCILLIARCGDVILLCYAVFIILKSQLKYEWCLENYKLQFSGITHTWDISSTCCIMFTKAKYSLTLSTLIICNTHYHNSNLIWRTVSRRVDEVIPSDHPRRVASSVIQWYGIIHETWYCTPDQVTIMIICLLYAFFLTFFLILKPVRKIAGTFAITLRFLKSRQHVFRLWFHACNLLYVVCRKSR